MLGSSHKVKGKDIFKTKFQSWFTDSVDNDIIWVAANMPALKEGGTIRKFKAKFDMEDGTELPSFAYALAKIAAPEKARALDKRGNDLEYIYYPSTEFKILMPSELYDRGEELTGKVVLVGVLNDPGDMHRTPLDAHNSGTIIQAYALNTILTGNFLNDCPTWVGEVTALIITILFAAFSLSISSGVRGMFLRILQLILLYLLLYAGYWFFLERNVMVDFSRSFLMLAFTFFAVDIWNGLWVMYGFTKSKIKKLRKRPKVLPDKT